MFARPILIENEISPYILSFRFNKSLLSYLDYEYPHDAFDCFCSNEDDPRNSLFFHNAPAPISVVN